MLYIWAIFRRSYTVTNYYSIFGNIDNVASTRSMITVIAGSSVDLLAISTVTMYTIAEEYPALKNRMRSHILFENLVSKHLD